MTTTITSCECGGTQPHAPARYIAPGVDGIDSTTRTCPGVVSEARGSLAGMTTATTTDTPTNSPDDPDDLETYITITEAAEALEMKPYGILRMVKNGWLDGELHAIRYGRAILVRECDVEALAEPVEGPPAPVTATEGTERSGGHRDFGLLVGIPKVGPVGDTRPVVMLDVGGADGQRLLDVEQLRQLAADAEAAADWLTPMSEGSARTLGAIADAADITLNELVDELGIDWDTATEADAGRVSRAIGERLAAHR